MTPICPKCRKPAKKTTTEYGVKHYCCGLWSWHGANLVDRDTHKARQDAHNIFDYLWETELMTRTDAYKLLARELGLSSRHCHMSLMNKDMLVRVPGAVNKILMGF